MLYLVGLGLGDAKDITVKGLEVVRRCSRVYLEAYTSVLTVGKEALVSLFNIVSYSGTLRCPRNIHMSLKYMDVQLQYLYMSTFINVCCIDFKFPI